MRKIYFQALLIGALLLVVGELSAQVSANQTYALTMRARAESVVTGARVSLGEIGEVEAAQVRDDEAAVALRRIVLPLRLLPGERATISAEEILRVLRDQGVNLNDIGYALPRVMVVTRTGRPVSMHEIRQATEELFDRQGRQAEIRSIQLSPQAAIDPRTDRIEILPIASATPGQLRAQIVPFDSAGGKLDAREAEFTAQLQEWQEVPVAARSLGRGTVISEGDIVLARMNTAQLPPDAILEPEAAIGMLAQREIGFGETIRRGRTIVPPIIQAGARVAIVFRSGPMELTASGTALEAAPPGGSLRVRNDGSRRVILGAAVGPNEVVVGNNGFDGGVR